MNYTKVFQDTETGLEYFVTECSLDVEATLRHLVLFNPMTRNIVEVDNQYQGITVKKVGYVDGDLIEVEKEEFDQRFKPLN